MASIMGFLQRFDHRLLKGSKAGLGFRALVESGLAECRFGVCPVTRFSPSGSIACKTPNPLSFSG